MPAAINLLLVSDSHRWERAVRAAAVKLGGTLIHPPLSARDALSLLVRRQDEYSHLLIEPACAGELMGDFVGLTSGEAASGTEMLLLGATGSNPPRVGVITSASGRSVARALSPSRDRRSDNAKMDSTELRQAIAGCMIETRYQPIVALWDAAPVGLEALARMNHPARGTLTPDLFVPQIEAAGLAQELTDIVAGRAFADLASPIFAAARLSLAINLPLDLLLVPEAVDRLDARRKEAGLEAERIIVELTESRPVADLAALRVAIERLRRAGYGLAIDDVGPAVPQHEAMMEMPFTAMKLDKAVVQQAGHDADTLNFLARTIETAKARGLTVIAEGVEDLSTWRAMRELGADQAQGFLVSRPLPFAAVPVWLQAWREQPRLH